MGHLTVMKSTGTRWQIHLEPWREGEGEREMGGWMERDRQAEGGEIERQLGRKGRQWHSTGLQQTQRHSCFTNLRRQSHRDLMQLII